MRMQTTNGKLTRWLGWGVAHSLGIATIAVLFSFFAFDLTRFQLAWKSFGNGFEIDWASLALHVGLSACAWFLLIIAIMWGVERRRESKRKVVKLTRGSIMIEFLIILTPFLLLTSGLAQLTMLNITGMLADLAAFEAARVAWVWAPELDADRNVTPYLVKDRARATASMVLAPTAPNDYYVGRTTPPGSSNYYRRQRAILTGAFQSDGTQGPSVYEWSGGTTALYGGGAFDLDVEEASSENLYFHRSFDESSFAHRAARKMTFAEWGLWDDFEVIQGDRTGVRFTYRYNLIFPWFGYIWGKKNEVGMREGYYSPIPREHTFASQRSME